MIRIKSQRLIRLCGIAVTLICLPFQSLFANQYSLPQPNNSVIGDVTYTSAWSGETVVSIAQHNNVGVMAVLHANPGLPDGPQLSQGTYVKVPSKFLLPPLPRRGIVINLAEMRMYYYPEGSNSVMTFPVGIGRVGKTVPTGNTSITRKTVNPTWIPPEDIRQFNRDQGIELPAAMGPGPDNPLGPYALYLRVPTYLIHSTIFPESIGRRASFGCIRMHETDIKQFYPLVKPGTHVAIIDMPTKVGWNGDHLYLETHPPLEEYNDGGAAGMVNAIENSVPHKGVTIVNWQLVSYLAEQRDGVPHEIGFIAN